MTVMREVALAVGAVALFVAGLIAFAAPPEQRMAIDHTPLGTYRTD